MTRNRAKAFAIATSLLCTALLPGAAARAQLSGAAPSAVGGPNETGAARSTAGAINAATDVSVTQKLNNQVSLDTPFRDEDGKTVPLGSYFGKKPVLMVLPFYKCPGICTAELDGMVRTFRDPKLKFKLGRDFDVVTVSIDPTEQADLAVMKKREYLNLLSQPGADAGWHFLTGDEDNIRKLADEVGFKYKFNPVTKQYAHPGVLILLTPDGKVSRYFMGVEFPAKDVRLALTEGGKGKIGTPVDQIILMCYHYDPAKGKYGLAIFRIMQVAGFTTVAAVATFIGLSLRREKQQRRRGLGDDEEEKTAAADGNAGERA